MRYFALALFVAAVFMAGIASAQDNCSSAVAIDSLPYFTTGSTAGMADDFHCEGNSSPDVIYSLLAPDSGVYVISLCGSDYDTRLELRYGGSCPGDSLVQCEDNTCLSDTSQAVLGQSEIIAYLDAGVEYYVIVDGHGASDAGNYQLSISAPTACSPCPLPFGACTMQPFWTAPTPKVVPQWGLGVAADASGNVYYTHYQSNFFYIYKIPSVLAAGCAPSPVAQPFHALEVGTGNQVRIEEMTWDSKHNVMWGASRYVEGHPDLVNGRLPQTRIYTITFAGAIASCRFQFHGLGTPGVNWPTDGLAFDPNYGLEGSLWQHLNFHSTVTRFQLAGAGPTFTVVGTPFTLTPAVPTFAGIACGPNNQLYVAGKTVSNIYLVDKVSGAVNSSLPTASAPCNRHGIECDPVNYMIWSMENCGGAYPPPLITGYPINDPCCVSCPSPPPNDDCSGSISITACPYTHTGNTCCATPDYVNCMEDPSIRSRDVVYDLTLAGPSQIVTVSLCGSNFDTGLEVREGAPCPGLNSVACNDDFCGPGSGSQVTFTALGGVTYYIIVHSYTDVNNNSCGDYVLNVTCAPSPCPLPAGAAQCAPAGSRWGTGVAIDNQGHTYYTQYLTNPYTIYRQSSWCGNVTSFNAVIAPANTQQVRIEEMTWDCTHGVMWGASRSPSGANQRTQIYTIVFNSTSGQAECTFRFLGGGTPGPNYPTTGLTYDPSYVGPGNAGHGAIWQQVEDYGTTFCAFALNASLGHAAGSSAPADHCTAASGVPGYNSGICMAPGGDMWISHGTSPTITRHDRMTGAYFGASFDIQTTTTCAHRGLECDNINFTSPKLLCTESDNSGSSSPAYLTAYASPGCICQPVIPIAGDNCESVINIASLPYSDSSATVWMNEDFQCHGIASPDVIYSYTAPADDFLDVSMCGSSYDTRLDIRYGGACPGGLLIRSNDNNCGLQSSLGLSVEAGETYYFVVSGANGASGSYALTVGGGGGGGGGPNDEAGICCRYSFLEQISFCNDVTRSQCGGFGVTFYPGLSCAGWICSNTNPLWVIAGGGSSGVGVAANPHWLLETAFSSNQVIVLDTSGTVLDTITPVTAGGDTIHLEEISWDEDRQLVWGAERENIYLMDPSTGLCTFQFQGVAGCGATTGLTVDPTDSTLWQSTDAGTTIAHFSSSGILLGQLTPLDSLGQPDSSLSGVCAGANNLMYVSHGGQGRITAIEKSTGAWIREIRFPGWSTGMEIDACTFAPQTVLWVRRLEKAVEDLVAFPIETAAGVCSSLTPPIEVTNLVIKKIDDIIKRLYWSSVPDATSYNVYSSTDMALDPALWNLEGTTADTTFVDSTDGLRKFYFVKSAN